MGADSKPRPGATPEGWPARSGNGISLEPVVGTDGDLEVSLREEASDNHHDEKPPVRVLLLVMLCMFQGYASMVGPPQQKFKSALHIDQFGANANLFTQAATFVHWGKFVARLGHNVVFGWCSPLARVYIAMMFMLVGCAVPPLFVFGLGSTWIGTVFVSYGLSGIGLGVFECTFLAVITPHGKLTKAWAIMGAPIGFGLVDILGLLCTSANMPVEYLYWYIVACIPLGMVTLWKYAPSREQRASTTFKQASLANSLLDYRVWAIAMIPHIMGKIVVNFVMENVTPVNFYIYNSKQVPLGGKGGGSLLMDHDQYFALLYVFVILGDTVSRRMPYFFPLEMYSKNVALLAIAGVCSVLGFYLETFAEAALTLPAIFLAFWGNGLVYGVSAKYIDKFVPKEHNLAAYSLWCFVGDLGSILGGSLVDVIRNWICGGHEYPFECRSHNR